MSTLQWDLKSELCLRISDLYFHGGVPLLLSNRDAAFLFHNLRRLLGQDSNTILSGSNGLNITWFNITYRLRIGFSYLSISWVVVYDEC